MISRLVLLGIVTALMTTLSAFGQQAPSRVRVGAPADATQDAWPENYVLSLTGKDGETAFAEITLMLASPSFQVDSPSADSQKSPSVNFSGVVVRNDDGSLTVTYAIGMEIAVVSSRVQSEAAGGKPVSNESFQYKTSGARSTVRLKPGEAAEILRTGTKVWRLGVDRVAARTE